MIRPGFTGAPLDRADRFRLDPGRIAALRLHSAARLLRLSGVDPVLDEAGRLVWDALSHDADLLFLGLDGDAPVFAPLVAIADAAARPPALFQMLGEMAPEDAALWGVARSLINWHGRHGFCANCGSPTVPFRAGWARKCGGCGAEHYPRVDPVVIMLAECEGRVLVGRQPQYPFGRYSALAGFVEPGESIEEAVARELKEEAGIEVSGVRYVASQPWPFPGSLMIACIAAARDDAITIDTTELEDAKWVDRAGVEAALSGQADAPFLAPPHFAIAHTLFLRWLAGSAAAA
ncbi:NAD(+) diphosphatase [Allosphingosinicella flava]|uniref:NAD(+) diphosphatase n=1 Tax=Allosphingosinicella flava TaxID=2771430 RepID=A0A7T2GJ31_9SPHN|nr:NAD(+) diphosphatase [Sphingosinicella flava]QPQ54811.1 NAD(+) diphosphatase [Sphingosinicella flava]